MRHGTVIYTYPSPGIGFKLVMDPLDPASPPGVPGWEGESVGPATPAGHSHSALSGTVGGDQNHLVDL